MSSTPGPCSCSSSRRSWLRRDVRRLRPDPLHAGHRPDLRGEAGLLPAPRRPDRRAARRSPSATGDGLELVGDVPPPPDRRAARAWSSSATSSSAIAGAPCPTPTTLRDAGFDLFTFDFRNHGNSESEDRLRALPVGLRPRGPRPEGGARLPPDPARPRPGRLRPVRRQPGRRHGDLRRRPTSPTSGPSPPTAPSRPAARCSPTSSAGPRSTSAAGSSGGTCRSASSPSSAGPAGSARQWRLRRIFPDIERAAARLGPRPWLMIHGERDAYIGPDIARGLFDARPRAEGPLARPRRQAQPLPRDDARGLPPPARRLLPPGRPAGARRPSLGAGSTSRLVDGAGRGAGLPAGRPIPRRRGFRVDSGGRSCVCIAGRLAGRVAVPIRRDSSIVPPTGSPMIRADPHGRPAAPSPAAARGLARDFLDRRAAGRRGPARPPAGTGRAATPTAQFGRDHHFAAIRIPEDFRRRVPIRGYDGHEPYIARVRQGRPSALFGPGTEVLMFAMTSGHHRPAQDDPGHPRVAPRLPRRLEDLGHPGLRRPPRDHPRTACGRSSSSPATGGSRRPPRASPAGRSPA